MFNKLEQLELKLEKTIGIYKHAGKVKKLHWRFAKITKCKWLHLKFTFVLSINQNQSMYMFKSKSKSR